jgi:glycosyltransferase involved in cell wall biosynthesis
MADPHTNVVIWSSDWHRTNGQAIVTRRVVEGLTSVNWTFAVYRPGRSKALSSVLRATLILWRALLFDRVPIIYLVCSRSTFGFLRDLPALAAVLLRRRVIVHCHGSDIVDLLSCRRISSLARLLYRRCEIVVPTKHLVPDLELLGMPCIAVCENFVDLDLTAKTGPIAETENIFLVVWNSNIMSSKGFFDTAKAVELARARGVAVKLLSLGEPVGDSEMSAVEARQRLDALMGKDWFEYRGRVSPEEAITQTAKADVVVLPSRYSSECQPLSLIQAMCCGVAVIVADTPALRETVLDYPALILDDVSAECISNALERLQTRNDGIDDNIKKERQTAVLRARARFSKDRFDHEMLTILRG